MIVLTMVGKSPTIACAYVSKTSVKELLPEATRLLIIPIPWASYLSMRYNVIYCH